MELPLQHGMMDSKSGRQMLSDDDDDLAFAEAQFEPDPEDKAFLAREIAKDIAVAKAGEDLPHAMFDPRENFMITWASMVAVCIIYNVIYGPIQVAFRVPAHDVLGKFDDYCDLVFILDVVLTFRTCLVHDVHGHEELITDRSVIAKRYLEGFFLIDVCSIGIPFGLGATNRVMDVMRMAKVLRLIKLNQLVARLWTPPTAIAKVYVLTKMLLFLCISAHVFGCFYWMFFTELDGTPYEESWIMAGEFFDPDAEEKDYFAMYMPGLYFSLMTLTTVGYGDISASTPSEMVFVSILMLAGAVLYAIVLGISTSVLMSVINSNEELQDRMEVMDKFFNKFELDNKTREHVIKTLQLQWDLAQSFEIEGPLRELPRQLFKQVMLTWHRPLLLEVPFFARCDSDFLAEVVCALKMQVCLKGVCAVTAGEVGRDLYFLGHGSGHSLAANGELALTNFQPGSYFGEVEVLFHCCRRVWSVEMTSNSELYKLEQSVLRDLLDNFPKVGLEMHIAAKARLAKDLHTMVTWLEHREATNAPPLQPWNTLLVVRVNEAQINHEFGNVKAYCRVKVGSVFRDRTPTVYNSNNPIWKNKVFSFSLNKQTCRAELDLWEKNIEIGVFDKGTFVPDKHLGSTAIPFDVIKTLHKNSLKDNRAHFKEWVDIKGPHSLLSQVHLQIWLKRVGLTVPQQHALAVSTLTGLEQNIRIHEDEVLEASKSGERVLVQDAADINDPSSDGADCAGLMAAIKRAELREDRNEELMISVKSDMDAVIALWDRQSKRAKTPAR